MIRWLLQSVVSSLYRVTQHCLQALPAGLLRFRPFGVYQFELPSEASICPIATETGGYRIRWITSQAETRQLLELASPENIDSWNNTSRRAAAVWQDNVPVAVAWIASKDFAEAQLGMRYCLYDGDVWLFAAVVKPVLRRQGIYGLLLGFLLAELSQTGTRRILLGVSTGNLASQVAHTRHGAKQVGKIFVARCLGVGFYQVQGAVQRLSKRSWSWRQAIEVSVDFPPDSPPETRNKEPHSSLAAQSRSKARVQRSLDSALPPSRTNRSD